MALVFRCWRACFKTMDMEDDMGKVKILTNSVSDLPPALAKSLDVELIPDMIIMNGKEYRNNIDIDPPTLYQMLHTAENLPTTAYPDLETFMSCFRSAAAYDAIVYISLTSKMSGSYSAACSAKKLLEEEGFSTPLFIYDSLQVSLGLAQMVLEAAKIAQAGANVQQVLAGLDALRPRIGVYFVMKSLKNAKKGGRVGAIRVLAADLLGVKPVLMFRDGLVKDVGIVRSFGQGISEVVKRYKEQAQMGGMVFIFHAANEHDAHVVKEQILKLDPAAQVSVQWVGAVIGIYTGDGCVGISFRERDVPQKRK